MAESSDVAGAGGGTRVRQRAEATAAVSSSPDSIRRVRLYGFEVALQEWLGRGLTPSPGMSEVDLRITYAARSRDGFGDREELGSGRSKPVLTAPAVLQSGAGRFRLFQAPERMLLSFQDILEYRVSREVIHCRLLEPGWRHMVRPLLLGVVLALWLEQRGIPALHGSAVRVGNRAAVFLAGEGGGKTSLAASLMERGHGLLSDDLLPVESTHAIRPGPPQMKMWPDLSRRFLNCCDGLGRVHPEVEKLRIPLGSGRFGSPAGAEAPIGAIYLPSRTREPDSGGVELSRISHAQALMELVRHSYAPNSVRALGLEPRRLERLAAIARDVPVFGLRYANGLHRLPRVAAAVEAQLGERAGG